jgi:glycosyltransferase involved in cell wall biosynthesis
MVRVYFDVTDIVQYAARNNTVVGIPRVQLNIISLLARQQRGAVIRCVFFKSDGQGQFEFDPALRSVDHEFDGERLLIDLGLVKPAKFFPSKVQVKSYLKRYSSNKPLRALKKAQLYVASIFMRRQLRTMGFKLGAKHVGEAIPVTAIDRLPPNSVYVSLGAVWLLPKIWEFAAAHKARGGTVVQMVYDLIPIFHPEYYTPREPPAFTAWIDSALGYATKIICISEWTAKDLRAHAKDKLDLPVVAAIPLAHEFIGFDRLTRVERPESLAHLQGTSYVLCVGTIEFRKNGIALLRVWRQLSQELAAMPKLVFAGKYGKGGAEFQAMLAADAGLREMVHVVHAPSDQDLAWLYQNCLFTTYPSLFEGWGLPVGESAWFGKYCVASNVTSIPEVCGALLEYVDAASIDSIGAGIRKALTDAEFRRNREREIAAATLRRWHDVAEDIYSFATSD